MSPELHAANMQVAGAYDPAVANIQAQIPAIQQLYGALLQGLQGQAGAQVQNVVQSAAQRGVGRAGLAGDTTAMLGDTLAQQQAQLGAQQATNIGGLQGQIGQANVARATNANDIATTIFNQGLQQQKNAMANTAIERQYALQQQQNQQSYDVKAIEAARARAAAQTKTPMDMSQEAITRELRAGMERVKGKDGHVSPETLATAYKFWSAAGLAPDAFWKNFQGNWNPKQKDYGAQFHYFAGR